MKKIRKIVLSVLLFTFAFISIHDYAMIDIQSNTAYELVHVDCEESAVELTSHIHDNIHSLLLDSIQKPVTTTLLPPYQKQTQARDLFISYINSVPVRPPLS